jgi:hypothetical protein
MPRAALVANASRRGTKYWCTPLQCCQKLPFLALAADDARSWPEGCFTRPGPHGARLKHPRPALGSTKKWLSRRFVLTCLLSHTPRPHNQGVASQHCAAARHRGTAIYRAVVLGRCVAAQIRGAVPQCLAAANQRAAVLRTDCWAIRDQVHLSLSRFPTTLLHFIEAHCVFHVADRDSGGGQPGWPESTKCRVE